MSSQDRPAPIKRHPRLQPISRANHQGLMFCLLLEKGVRQSIETARLADFTEYFWTSFWSGHRRRLRDSLRQFMKHSDPLWEAYCQEYDTLTKLWGEGTPLAKSECITELKDELRSFIRWQERSLFKNIQDCYAAQLEQFSFPEPTHEVCARWSDPFWD